MSTSDCCLEQLAERVIRLEKQNRRLKQLMAGLFILGGLGVLTAAQQEKTQPIDSNALVLRDRDGKVRARMESGKEGPVLQFFNEKGQPQAAFGSTRDAVQFQLYNNAGGIQTGVALQKEGVAMISYTPDGKLHSGPNAIMVTGGVLTPP